MACIRSVMVRRDERLTYQAESYPFRVIVPGVGKIAQGGPGIFSLTNVSISPCHGLNGCGHGRWFLLLVLVCPGHDFKHAECHESFPLFSWHCPMFTEKYVKRLLNLFDVFFLRFGKNVLIE